MARITWFPVARLQLRLVRNWKRIAIFIAIAIPLIPVINELRPRRIRRTVIHADSWGDNPTVGCEGNFAAYGAQFVQLRHAKLDKHSRTFSIPCKGKIPNYDFEHGKEGTPLKEWLRDLKTISESAIANYTVVKNPTVVVLRHEAHNLFHTLCEWYNVFLLSILLKFNPNTVDIIFLDDRPASPIDPTWDVLFGKVMRYSEIPNDVIFERLIWNVIGYESPANFHWQYVLPHTDEFYRFFINAYKVPIKQLDCSKLVVRIIYRRDYMSHPERSQIAGGLVHRKFANEEEILTLVKSLLPPSADVQPVVLEKMTMYEQVKLFTNTDILIGMHGAGMSHVMFLPPHAAVFELFPRYWGQLYHFRAFSRWRGLKYLVWKNINYRNERRDYFTYIPPVIFRLYVPKLLEYVCPDQ